VDLPDTAIIHQHWKELPFEDFFDSDTAVVLSDESDDPNQPTVVMLAIEFKPDFYVAAHQHSTGHIEVVLEGMLTVGGREEHPGDVRVVPAFNSYGPLRAGPEGCKCLEIFPSREGVLPIVDNPEELATRFGDASQLRDRLAQILKISS